MADTKISELDATNVAALRTVMSIPDDPVDAKQRYGITSSPTADQTSQFQDMADDLTAGNAGSRTVILPAGEFHIAGTVNFNRMGTIQYWPTASAQGHGGLNIRGQGVYGTRIIQDTAGVSTFRVYQPATGVQTFGVEFADFLLEGPGLTNTGSAGIQLGGVSVTSDIMFMMRLKNLLIRNFSTSVILDDCTNAFMEHVVLEGYNYGIEFGFNIDLFTALQCGFGSQVIPANLTGSVTSASTTVSSTNTAGLVAGMQIQSDDFPQGTTVASITNATVFVASAAATATRTTTMDMCQGVGLSYGGGPFAPASGASTGSANGQNFINCWFMRNAHCLKMNDNTSHNIKLDGCYFERSNRVATLTPDIGSSGTHYLIFDNCHFSQVEVFQDYAIYEDIASSGAGTTVIRNCRSDGSSPVPWYRVGSQNALIDWDSNLLNSDTHRIEIFNSSFTHDPSNGKKWTMNNAGSNVEPINAGATGSLPIVIPPFTDCSVQIGPMTGNVTVQDISAGTKNAMKGGERIRFIIAEDGTAGRTVTWNAAYKFHTAWTNSTVTTDAGKKSYVDFIYDKDRNFFIQVGSANSWI